jgi:hypothetical protein
MNANNYWLVSIDEEEVNVSLVLFDDNKVSRIIVGKPRNYEEDSEDSLVFAVDASLSETSLQAGISEEEEPESAAFILSPFWIDIDGQISPEKFKLVEKICKKLKLNPLGFIGNDDAFVENQTQDESNPSSYILINLKQHQFNLSLVYFGKIKERFHQVFEEGFSPKTIENKLNSLSSESALPPVLIFFGDTLQMPVDDIKNYPWIGKKIGDIFFHLPEIKFYSIEEITKIWSDFINYQIIGSEVSPIVPESVQETNPSIEAEQLEPEVEAEMPKPEPEIETDIPTPEPEPEINFDTVPMESLGFSSVKETKPKKKIKLPSLPKIKFPKIKFNFLLWIFAFIPLLFLTLLLINKVDITLYLTPYPITATVPITLDSQITDFDVNSKKIPVTVKTFEIKVDDQIETTGKQVVGEKARGSIIVYNKQDKVQNIPKGAILTAADGQQFELLTPIQIAGSTSDFAEGIMKFGQTKTVITASAIGPESNLSKDLKLTFKDFSETLIIAKAELDFSGGTKNEVMVVSKNDKIALEQRLKEKIQQELDSKIKNDVKNLSGVLLDTIQTNTKRIEFNRDLNEQTDQLSATLESTVTVFAISATEKNKIISALIDSPEKSKWDVNNLIFDLKMEVEKIDATGASGNLIVDGKAAPLLNIKEIRAKIAGKTKQSAFNYFKDHTAFYNWEFQSNLPFIGKIILLPVIGNNITIISKIN